jgi:UDP-glucose 6-dehydrogenase
MEMLIKILIGVVGFAGSLCAVFFAWVGISIVDMKTELAVTHEKVANVEEMVKPLWEQYISEKLNANIALTNLETNK